ncbi:tRNA (adenosine(37)-N6)-threonylcarbamoyltransferase complex transferase subunit TsaD [candidate division WWE3 bacterium RIFOXYC1_FULL_40_10]|uniref:tRNA N6-adenosine threonylcarbamoyltransferase n=1 Tax=candidate division WWE3 bacterium RIFOXYA2_FULL_46_9 TaxID=1802636 RepID=A0A1F4W124_UNCKA|nr:MAG: tRNA (adenosine(37)-N6)-threonylcarbamoyltransferase complex transferase subunit TsaD [candidate division WWE3 bacterium RIFOXYB1_FULL_40_22]OGC62101.1 MAG: tRNA (adenosine(37)-N6)-threonylcarbamoyltransferase complex transferase subunit TsaD [candidate division WWE3 bacterium RIFOXYA1_FULL_40_11]OGC63116.1 MAG: tRNA (adenosine(37)-N6)-threonylcarbamoyltransferase complex transferase subunit TsaD [candidate division WWE3 bacterium RIFOXYA2_FULL_46_9]OGC64956.1 MAG: tRNA (adenosine(37)-N6
MIILGIETSCDETAAALVENGVKELSSEIASSKDFHEKTGGIVPEIAARKQLECIVPVIESTLKKGNVKPAQLDAIAVTVGPGLIGSLIVGVESAKALSLAWHKPVVPVNHLVAHIYANFIGGGVIEFPFVALLVSGGHTDLILLRAHDDFDYLGGTLDDAAGEAFDKTARLIGISRYLGGAKLSKLASTCEKNTLSGRLPRPLLHDNSLDFSFSGLKTAVKRLYETEHPDVSCISKEFETAVVDVLVEKTTKAVKRCGVKSVLLGGGVAANMFLREALKGKLSEIGVSLHVPSLDLCTDNAVTVASRAFFAHTPLPLSSIVANPSLGFMD